MTGKLSLMHKVMQVEGNIAGNMDGSKVMLSMANGKYYNLGTTGGDIWEAIQTPTTISDVVSSLMSVYDVEREQCEKKVLSFMERMYGEELIQLCD